MGNVKNYETACCALVQLSVSEKRGIKKEIQTELSDMYYQAVIYDNEASAGAAFVITTPEEKKLPKILKELGFKLVYKINRYSEKGLLSMWIKNITKEDYSKGKKFIGRIKE